MCVCVCVCVCVAVCVFVCTLNIRACILSEQRTQSLGSICTFEMLGLDIDIVLLQLLSLLLFLNVLFGILSLLSLSLSWVVMKHTVTCCDSIIGVLPSMLTLIVTRCMEVFIESYS